MHYALEGTITLSMQTTAQDRIRISRACSSAVLVLIIMTTASNRRERQAHQSSQSGFILCVCNVLQVHQPMSSGKGIQFSLLLIHCGTLRVQDAHRAGIITRIGCIQNCMVTTQRMILAHKEIQGRARYNDVCMLNVLCEIKTSHVPI